MTNYLLGYVAETRTAYVVTDGEGNLPGEATDLGIFEREDGDPNVIFHFVRDALYHRKPDGAAGFWPENITDMQRVTIDIDGSTTPVLVITGYRLEPASTELVAEGTEQFELIAIYDDESEEPFEGDVDWESDDTNVFTVNSSGLVTAVAPGEATLTAKVDDEEVATATVTVNTVAVTGVTATPSTVTLAPEATQQISVTVAPANATNQDVSYESSATGVATVNSSGLITAVSEGSATITVTTDDGEFTDTVEVTVEE